MKTSATLRTECEAVADELLAQPELLRSVFSTNDQGQVEEHTPPPPPEAIKRYTGERSAADDRRLLMVGALRLLGASDREIEQACGLTRRTIPVLMLELERSGRVTPLRERLVALVGDNAERSSLLLRRLLDRGLDGEVSVELAAMLKAAGSVNCFQVEKHQLLTGQATERIEQRGAALGREELERWWRETVVECPSTVEAENPKETGQIGSAATGPIRAGPGAGPAVEEGGGGGQEPGCRQDSDASSGF